MENKSNTNLGSLWLRVSTFHFYKSIKKLKKPCMTKHQRTVRMIKHMK